MSTQPNPVKLESATPVFVVRDVMKSLAYFRDVLGFRVGFEYGKPTYYAGVVRDSVNVHLHAAAMAQRPPGNASVYLFVDDVKTYFDQISSRGASVESPPADRPYGLCDFTALDLDGNRLVFATPSDYQRPARASDVLPAHIRIDVGLPDIETYMSLFDSVNWGRQEPSMRVVLANTLVGVVAIDTRDGQTVGMARSTGDGRYYMLWDVIVRPSHQGHRIGQAMVERALDELRKRGAPAGGFIGLFTQRPGFYEKLGFKKDFAMHRAL